MNAPQYREGRRALPPNAVTPDQVVNVQEAEERIPWGTTLNNDMEATFVKCCYGAFEDKGFTLGSIRHHLRPEVIIDEGDCYVLVFHKDTPI